MAMPSDPSHPPSGGDFRTLGTAATGAETALLMLPLSPPGVLPPSQNRRPRLRCSNRERDDGHRCRYFPLDRLPLKVLPLDAKDDVRRQALLIVRGVGKGSFTAILRRCRTSRMCRN